MRGISNIKTHSPVKLHSIPRHTAGHFSLYLLDREKRRLVLEKAVLDRKRKHIMAALEGIEARIRAAAVKAEVGFKEHAAVEKTLVHY